MNPNEGKEEYEIIDKTNRIKKIRPKRNHNYI